MLVEKTKQSPKNRAQVHRLMNAYERACVKYAALIEELREAERSDFELKLEATAAARERCSVARARISSFFRRRGSGRFCRVYS